MNNLIQFKELGTTLSDDDMKQIMGGYGGGGSGSITIYCKDDNGTLLGTVTYSCNGGQTRIQTCKDATYTNTTMTTGPACT